MKKTFSLSDPYACFVTNVFKTVLFVKIMQKVYFEGFLARMVDFRNYLSKQLFLVQPIYICSKYMFRANLVKIVCGWTLELGMNKHTHRYFVKLLFWAQGIQN